MMVSMALRSACAWSIARWHQFGQTTRAGSVPELTVNLLADEHNVGVQKSITYFSKKLAVRCTCKMSVLRAKQVLVVLREMPLQCCVLGTLCGMWYGDGRVLCDVGAGRTKQCGAETSSKDRPRSSRI